MTLVDTPSSGSGNNDKAQGLAQPFEGADLVLLLISADQPISHGELDLLQGIRRAAPVFVVQNKVDYLPKDERQASLDFLRKVLNRELADDTTRVIQVSAKRALKARVDGKGDATGGVARLEKAIVESLSAEKGAKLLAEARLGLGRLAKEASQVVKVESQLTQLPPGDLQPLKARFEEEINEIFTSQRRAEFNIRRGALAVASRVEEEIKELIFRHLSMVDQRTKEVFARSNDLRARMESLKALADELESAGQELLVTCAAVQNKHAGRSQEKLKEIFEQHATEVFVELERLTKELFGVGVTVPIGDNILLQNERDRLVGASPMSRTALGLLPLILPSRFATRLARSAFRRAASHATNVALEMSDSFRREYEQESQSFIHDFRERVRLSVGKIEDALERCNEMQLGSSVKREARLRLLAKDTAKLEVIQGLADS